MDRGVEFIYRLGKINLHVITKTMNKLRKYHLDLSPTLHQHTMDTRPSEVKSLLDVDNIITVAQGNTLPTSMNLETQRSQSTALYVQISPRGAPLTGGKYRLILDPCPIQRPLSNTANKEGSLQENCLRGAFIRYLRPLSIKDKLANAGTALQSCRPIMAIPDLLISYQLSMKNSPVYLMPIERALEVYLTKVFEVPALRLLESWALESMQCGWVRFYLNNADISALNQLKMDNLVLLRNMVNGASNERSKSLYQQLSLAHNSLGTTIIHRYANALEEGSCFFDGMSFKKCGDRQRCAAGSGLDARGIEIIGNECYTAQVKDALEDITFTPSGRRLLQLLLQKKVVIQPPSMADIVRIEQGKFLASNKVGGNVITFDPENHLLGADKTLISACP
ncbi:hypothetical protein SODG_001825 [Sodalis praecaptivus]|uniref:hypothetical protein n=1 Tax=Sodalis praecaptivus TaxID=1239307 RepID=UPI0027F1CEEF|nr:hypothetical protein [Sodalis praecaptivus]CAJ0994784.1 hypothetical protein NVIRENTERO_01588 [Sodalis praecaptivus]